MQIVRLISVCLLLLALPFSTAAATSVVLGDSIGVGVTEVSGLKGLARNGIHIRGPRALRQMRAAPANSTAFVVLGTNDAEGSIKRLDKYIDDLLGLAEKKHISIVWLGPPCVRKSWDSRARKLDEMLSKRFAGTSVKYVSMRDKTLCSGAYQEPDGVHLKRKGYVHMWQKAQAAARSTKYDLASLKKVEAKKSPTVEATEPKAHKLAVGKKATEKNSLAMDMTVTGSVKPPADNSMRRTRTVFIFPRASSQ